MTFIPFGCLNFLVASSEGRTESAGPKSVRAERRSSLIFLTTYHIHH